MQLDYNGLFEHLQNGPCWSKWLITSRQVGHLVKLDQKNDTLVQDG